MEKIKGFLREEEGATMVEYGFMVSLIAVVVAAAVGPFGTTVADLFSGVPLTTF